MEKLKNFLDDVEIGYVADGDDRLVVTTNGMRFDIKVTATGAYVVETADGENKTFFPNELNVWNYIINKSTVSDKRDIFHRPVKRFLLASEDCRSLCGTFDTREEAQARADEINEWAAEDGDPAESFKIIDMDA